MKTVNIRELKNNPSAALRFAQDDLVVVMNRHTPQALLVDLKCLGIPDTAGVRVALAVALFKQGSVSLGYAARIADKTLPEMMEMLLKMRVPISPATQDDIEHDLKVAHTWFQTHPPASSPMQAH